MRRLSMVPGALLLPLAGLALALLLFADLLFLPTTPAQSQERERCFAQTGFCIRGAILDYWEQYGGLAVFGYPISDLRTETVEGTRTVPVQWFERDRLEEHGIQGVLAGRLGAELLEQRGYDMWDPDTQAAPKDAPGCIYIEKTNHNLCEPFLSYWQEQGGLARFGYPLTEAFEEQVGDWKGTVQYFERRRMEYHVNGDGTTAQILLGHLGKDLFAQHDPSLVCDHGVIDQLRDSFERVPFHRELGCPGQVHYDVPAAEQSFERGRMLRATLGEDGTMVYALSTMPLLFQQTYQDTTLSSQAASSSAPQADLPEPPPGRLAPQHEFATVWREHNTLRDVLGWATTPEVHTRATVQQFAHGWLVWMQGTNTVYAFGADTNHLTIFTRPNLTPGSPSLLGGEPAPPLGGDLVVRTYSVDFYRLAGGLTPEEVRAISSAVEEAIASGSTMLGSNLRGRVSVRFEPRQQGPCAIRGLTLSNQRTIRMFYEPGYNLSNIEAILAHEFVHQLQHDRYGVPYHLRSDVILLEGMAVWGSNPYYLDEQGQPMYHARSRQAMEEGILLPLTTSLEADCRTSTRNFIYDQWASFVEYLLVTYGRDKLDDVYVNSTGRPAGSSNYQAVYGKSLAQLEADWIAWLAARP